LKAVILAAGEGSRLQPLTFTRSKHMIFIAGKPILEYLLVALRDGGITDVYIVISHYKDIIQSYFGDGKKWSIKIQYILQEKLLGTADAIAVVEEYIGHDDFLVVYGDLLIDSATIKSALKKHSETGLTVLSTVSVLNPLQYGVVTLRNDLVQEIVEKPKQSTVHSNLVNAGVYVFSSDIFG
jgi:NDP-sugar pyrophosphorylase family protein